MIKPYNTCADCPHLGINCDGPNFLAMTPERWLEWTHLRKDHLDVTNAWIAEKGDLSRGTVDRVLAGHHGDLRMSTMQGITKALVGGTWGQYPCPLAAMDLMDVDDVMRTLSERASEADRLRTELAKADEIRHAEVTRVEELQQSKIDYLKTMVDEIKHSNRTYRITVAVMGFLMAAAVLIDACLRNFGWIRW